MKKILSFTILVITITLLSGCSGPVSETGYDLTPLEECIGSMIDDNSNQACDTSVKEAIIEEYANSFMEEYADEQTQYNDSDLTYSTSRDSSIVRIEFWFLFSLLPENISVAEYENFKGIIEAMSIELRDMYADVEFIFSGEFLFMDDTAFKFHHDASDDISGEIIYWGLLSDFETTYNANETFLLDKANDEDLILQELTIVTGDHNVKISVYPQSDEYDYQIYFTAEDAVMTISEVETLINTSFTSISFTQQD